MGNTNLMPFGKNKWEKDWNEPISDDTWHKIVQVNVSICLKHAAIQFTLVCRLSKIKADRNPSCDPATLSHMFRTFAPCLSPSLRTLGKSLRHLLPSHASVSPWWAPVYRCSEGLKTSCRTTSTSPWLPSRMSTSPLLYLSYIQLHTNPSLRHRRQICC